jgi:L-ascorbate metabolism protein UlaG (beta-lactamase superfamily)
MPLQEFACHSILTDLASVGDAQEVSLWWLGQAGFCLRYCGLRIGIDLYLSNSLARKYAGTRFPHRRMLPAPVLPEDLSMLDFVFCTHGHTDHMDGDTLGAIAQHNPTCLFVVPAAERDKALDRGVPQSRMISVCAGDQRELRLGASFSVVPAAHEERKTDAAGNDFFLGYLLKLGRRCIYHPGDCIPFEGQQDWLSGHEIDLALMPINGRDEFRRSNGVPGNFSLDEAVELCRCTGIASMLGHHYGMFDFNTVQPGQAADQLQRLAPDGRARLVELAKRYVLSG